MEDFFAVAPTDTEGRNVLRRPLRPVAAWELDDSHFAFDSSVLLPSMTADLAELILLVRAIPGTLLSVFGHTDTTGNNEYNKVLSGRRAMALFALLTRRVDLWEFLFSHPHGGDDWRKSSDFALKLMREALGVPATVPRPALFEQFMGLLAKTPDGSAFGLPARSFLGRGADRQGKGDFQGCGEFNPLVMFSATEAAEFRKPDQKAARDEAGAPNRRVTVLLFPADTRIDVKKWPCPRALEGTADCRKRLWSDQAARRSFGEQHRAQPKDSDTFSCRFYDRLAPDAARGRKVRSLGRLVIRAEPVAPELGRSQLVVLDPAGNVVASAQLNPENPRPGESREIVLEPPFASGTHTVERRIGDQPHSLGFTTDVITLVSAILTHRSDLVPDPVRTSEPKPPPARGAAS